MNDMKTKVLIALGVILVLMGVGYAALMTNLTINGTAEISGKWDIYISDISEKRLNQATTVETKVESKTTASFDVNLEKPGSYAEYDVTVKNEGNLDAVLKGINGLVEANQQEPTDVLFAVKDLVVDSPLNAGSEITFTVRVEFKSTATSLAAATKTLTLSLDYEQGSGDAIEPNPSSTSEPVITTGVATEVLAAKNTEGNTDGLITDDFSNIRYAGKNVKNYVNFDQEKWRIIGVIDGKLKLVRSNVLNTFAWDSADGKNWASSSLAAFLNDIYFMSLSTSNLVVDGTYYLGGTDAYVTKQAAYTNERASGSKTWTGKMGLMNASDYAYAAGDLCNTTLEKYNDASCTSNNWLFLGENEWLITPGSYFVWYVTSSGIVNTGFFGGYPTDTYEVRPVVYLNANVKITGGDGSSSNPYDLSL